MRTRGALHVNRDAGGERRIAIDSKALDEKATALGVLASLVIDLGACVRTPPRAACEAPIGWSLQRESQSASLRAFEL